MDAIQERLAKTEEKMKKSIAALDNEYKSIRAGRATPAILDKLTVEYYGAPTKIDQMAGDQRAGGALDGDSAVGSDYAEHDPKGNPCF